MSKQGLINLAVDVSKGRAIKAGEMSFSATEASEKLREKMIEQFGLDPNGKLDRRTFNRVKGELFEIIEVVIEETLFEGLEDQFDHFAETRNLKWGDENLFVVPDDELFRVAKVSDGNGNIRRQMLRDGQEFSIQLDTYAIKIMEGFHRFLAGKTDWPGMIQKISTSFQIDLTQKVYDAVYDSYGSYNGTYHFEGNLSEDQLIELVMHLQVRTGSSEIGMYGTKLALRKVAPAQITEAMKDAKNKVGFHTLISGIEAHEIKQSHKIGTDDFAIDNNFILLLPQTPDKMVKIVYEGEAIIQETDGGMTADMMKEYFFATRVGIALITSKAFGFVKLK